MSLDPRIEEALVAFVRKNVLPTGYRLRTPTSRDPDVLADKPWLVSRPAEHERDMPWEFWAKTQADAIEAAWQHIEQQNTVSGPGLTIAAGRRVIGGGYDSQRGVVVHYEHAKPPKGCAWTAPGVLQVRDGAILLSRSELGAVILKTFPFETGDELHIDPIVLRYFLDHIDSAGK